MVIISMPQPAMLRNGPPSPSGSNAAPSARNGMITKLDSGETSRLAARP